ncbi:amidohydrolase [Sphingomonas oryzagri]
MIKGLLFLASALAVPGAAFAAPMLDVPSAKAKIDASLARTFPDLETLYKDLHTHPELAFHETRTAALLAARMRKLGFTVTEHVGKTGLVALYKNGAGPTVLVRTELDALPVEEKTGLPYASTVKTVGEDGKETFVDHACGHDSHMAWWIGTAEALLAMKDQWHGTLMFVAQPAEEIVAGAKAMLADGLYTKFPKPDYGFAAHVDPSPIGTVKVKQGVVTSASDTVLITFKGVGAHGSMPDKSIDPIVEGAHFVNDVQTVISRQKDPQKFGVVTVGSFHAGTVANIISDHADLQLTLRSYEPEVRKVLNEGVVTTANAVAMMAHAPAPDIRHPFTADPVLNDSGLAADTAAILKTALGAANVDLVPESKPGWTASEDYSELVNAGMPHSVYFSVGGYAPETIAKYKAEGKPLPVNHSPYFAPVPEPTIRTGVETLTLAVLSVAGVK